LSAETAAAEDGEETGKGALNEKVEEDESSPDWDWASCGAIGFVWDEAVGREAKVQCSPGLEYKQRAKLA
jgi:hypothetical protein